MRYGQETPPLYDLSKISLPIAMAHGDVDQLSDLKDVAWLMDEQQSGLRVKDLVVKTELYHFGHNSFSFSKDASWFINDFMPVIADKCGNCIESTY